MACGLRKINKDGMHYGFKWILEVGATVECPDWDPKPECGNGLHFLPNAQGDWEFLDGYYWVVVEYEPTDLVLVGKNKGKVPRCKIVEIQEPDNLDPNKLLSYFDASKFNSQSAYHWAFNIGNRDIMSSRVTSSRWAYNWAWNIGNEDVMINRITESEWAYKWARWIGSRDVMINRVTEPEWAYMWARDIGDRNIMIDRTTDSYWAYEWALNIGDRDIMIDRITESSHAYNWAIWMDNRDIMKSKVTSPLYINCWNHSFPNDQIGIN